MQLEIIGLNHTTSRLSTRDRAAIDPQRLPGAVARILEEPLLEGVVVLSTCNRVELYLSPIQHLEDDAVRALFAEVCGLDADEAREAYRFQDEDAVEHLFRVVSGLDSKLLGEVQILGQVKDAYLRALEAGSSNRFLNGLFRKAIECGKMVRHRTAISRGALSVAHLAVDTATETLGTLNGRRVLLVGAGETIRLAAKYLAQAGVGAWRVSNRTASRARDLANKIQGVATAFPPRADDIAWADLVVCATHAPGAVVRAGEVAAGMSGRTRPLLVLDLAVPRDVEPEIGLMENIHLFSVDDFDALVRVNARARAKEAQRAERIVAAQVGAFVKWHQENRIVPSIRHLQEVLESIREAEVAHNVRRFRTEDREEVERLSKALMQKVTRLVVANMKRASIDQNDLSLARAVTQAFAQEDSSGVHDVLKRLELEECA